MGRTAKTPDYQQIHDSAMQMAMAQRLSLMEALKDSIEKEAKQIAEEGQFAQAILNSLQPQKG